MFVSQTFPLSHFPCHVLTATCIQSTYRPTLLADSTSLKGLKDLKIKLELAAGFKLDLLSLLGLMDLTIVPIVAYSARRVQA
jgi:hypothetical protein